MMAHRKVLFWFGIITLTFSFASLSVVLYWLNVPYKTVEIEIFKAVNSPIKQGDIVRLQVRYCKYTDKSELVNRYIVGEKTVVQIPPRDIIGRTPAGCSEQIQFVELPTMLEPGMKRLKYEVDYQLNPLRLIQLEFESEPFEVIQR